MLIKIDRFFAWLLFASMFAYFITGYGMTKELIEAGFSVTLHTKILPTLVIVAFTGHTSLAIRIAFIRWRIWNKITKIILILFYLFLIGSFFYVEYYYKEQKKAVTTSSPSPTISNTDAETKTKVFTLDELAKYNGQNGQPAYVGVKGYVYDVTSIFTSGSHFAHLAGQELTTAFYSRHVQSQIEKYPIVGQLN